jgi:hypothetical protein
MDVRIRMYMCTVCMWERVTYPAIPFALDLEGGAGKSKSLRVLGEPRRTWSERLCRILMVYIYVRMYAYENISIYMYVCMYVCM